ncbi:group II intron reverse transcriptase/maturase [Sporomusa sp.]|uniref:group II intron reverse transcriptase/maturase n=1 Tax=Sporomusa sp. TaxID=2078658 RepID=UPI002CCE99F2|nr:group II intron reverse transcriptase/maturase [Sporomusa sp.]HWR08974.1 group II intron reverse transcriptase/maturase [Sporomusa sp.]
MELIGATRKTKVHSLIDKVYHLTNLQRAWERVKENDGAGGIDSVDIQQYGAALAENLGILHEQLKTSAYRPMPVRRVQIPKRGNPGEMRQLGIPTIQDRVCQQALKNRLEPIFDPTFHACSFAYRPERSAHDAMRKIWWEIMEGNRWIVDADLRDYFGSVNHDKLIDMVAEKISDGRVLALIRQILKSGYKEKGVQYPTPSGTPQGGVISPLLSNIYLTPFDNEMVARGYKLTRFADDWLVVCRTKAEAEQALKAAREILHGLELEIHPTKTRITHISYGFEFLGYKVKQGKGRKLPKEKLKTTTNPLNLYAIPKEQSVARFKEQIRKHTRRRTPLTLKEVIDNINPIIRGWGNYFRKAHVRKLFNKLTGWIIHRLRSFIYRRWRNVGWKKHSEEVLYGKFGLVNLTQIIPSIGGRS